jgi:NAD-dependent DNA ligase
VESVQQFFTRVENRHTIERLRQASVRLDQPKTVETSTATAQVLHDKIFVLTGTLPSMTRQ